MFIEEAKKAIELEIEALQCLLNKIDENFEKAAELIKECAGRVVITGVGKSGHVGRKSAATFASLGTPACFMHATEGIHGDLGMIAKEDIVIALSYSGGTEETLNIISPIKQIGAKIIAVTGRPDSILARNSDIVLDIGVRKEADPLGLAPTSSTTATLAMCDALAIAVAVSRHFTAADFARFHPGGSLGRKLRDEVKMASGLNG
ncbi:SIS domain-containing protein [Candidatus Poribacteria bacterium]|nr:SIS domain-containing protein [Candidatus Poribacteria bacterium]